MKASTARGDEVIVAALCGGAYSVDSAGAIWLESPRGASRRVAKLTRMPDGYLRLWMRAGRFSAPVLAHRVVAIAFLGLPPDDKPEVNHKNGIKSDNLPANLEWVSPLENTHHAHASGLCAAGIRRGSANGRAKVTAEDVANIRARRAAGEPLRDIAADYPLSLVAISKIARGETWNPPPSL